jgi:hypothetical protein
MPDVRLASRAQHRLLWWKEVLLIVSFYAVYTAVRNRFGSARLSPLGLPVHAFDNAVRVIRLERAIGMYHEARIHRALLEHTDFVRFWNVYYGTAHFVVTIAAFVLVFRRAPHVFARWRNTLAFTTGFALIGFSLFPLMPPRLLDNPGHYGGRVIAEARGLPPFGFEDTMATIGGLWSFDSGTMSKISNQYAAMPSLHIGWSTWCMLALWPLVRRKWLRGLLVLYPLATLFCIVVTANHYWIDGVGGLVALAAGFAAGDQLHAWNQRRLARQRAALLARRLDDAEVEVDPAG